MVPQRRVRGARHGSGRLLTVALVGIDGSGKTTQAHRLADDLNRSGVAAHYWQNAGGRRWFGRLARRLGRGADAERLVGRGGMLVIESVLRWLAIARALLRSLLFGRVAVMDRYSVCQYASIRAHRPRRFARWEWLARLAYRIFPEPDVTFLLAVDPREAYRRIEQRGTDHESLEFLAAADAAYRSLPEHPDLVVIDANRKPDEVNQAIRAGLANRLPPPTVPSAPTGPPELRPDRRPERRLHWSVPTRRWRGSAPPPRSVPAVPTGSGRPAAARPDSPACR